MSTEKALNWIESIWERAGKMGIPAWENANGSLHDFYPETTGYIIPTLIKYGKYELALSLTNWLLSIQNEDGSFGGIDGTPRVFDTGAVLEGLLSVLNNRDYFSIFDVEAVQKAVSLATDWIYSCTKDGALVSYSESPKSPFYLIRVVGILNNKILAHKFIPTESWDESWENMRTHYLAYGLEGLFKLGGYSAEINFPIRKFLDNHSKSDNSLVGYSYSNFWKKSSHRSDVCATAQMIILAIHNGFKTQYEETIDKMIEGVRSMQHENGGIWHEKHKVKCASWTTKYYLDAEYAYKN